MMRVFPFPSIRLIFILLALTALQPGCQAPNPDTPRLYQRKNLFLNTVYSIRIYSRRSPETMYRTCRHIARELATLEQAVSFDRAGGDIYRLNRDAARRPVSVSPAVFDLLREAGRLYEQTDHVFDVTVKPLLNAWGFYIAHRQQPDPVTLHRQARSIGFHHVHLDPITRSVRFDDPAIQIDLGGLVKGYALDQAVRILRDEGYDNFYLNFGRSSHYGLGPGTGSGWPVEIGGPTGTGHPLATLTLDGLSLSVSDTGRTWQSAGGERYSFILDPRTGSPIDTVRTVAVLARRGVIADAWSTALGVDPRPLFKLSPSTSGCLAAVVFRDHAPPLFWPAPATARHYFRIPEK